jgi:hypothetical protein
LVAVKEATGTTPTRSGGLGAAGVVPEQRVADDAPPVVEDHHAVLLTCDRDRGDIVEASGGCQGLLKRGPPGGRVDLRALGMRAPSRAHQGAGLEVAHDHLAALRRRVDSRNQCHVAWPF